MRFYIYLAILAFLGFAMMSGCSSYNTFVSKDVAVEKTWGQVQSAYQERADLIPNLVNTVKGAADFEKETLENLVNARSKATSVNVDAGNLSAEDLARFQAAQGELSKGLGRLLAVIENYPDLKATNAFRDLQAQLEGQENRIRVERNRFNGAVADFNVSVRKFPSNFFASIFGFSEKPQFEAETTAQDVPKVEF